MPPFKSSNVVRTTGWVCSSPPKKRSVFLPSISSCSSWFLYPSYIFQPCGLIMSYYIWTFKRKFLLEQWLCLTRLNRFLSQLLFNTMDPACNLYDSIYFHFIYCKWCERVENSWGFPVLLIWLKHNNKIRTMLNYSNPYHLTQ